MAATPDPVEARELSPEKAAWAEPVEAPHSDGSDPYAALDLDTLRDAIRDRETDLAGARRDLYAARDDLTATALDLRICRQALEHREADLAGTRKELNALLDRHADLALERITLDKTVGDREADLAETRGELHALLDHHAHLALARNILESAIGDRERDIVQARQETAVAIEQGRRYKAQVTALEAEVRALQDAARAASAPQQASLEAPVPAKPVENRPTSHWDDFKFFLKFMFNLSDSYPVGAAPVRRARGADGAAAEVDRREDRSTRRGG